MIKNISFRNLSNPTPEAQEWLDKLKNLLESSEKFKQMNYELVVFGSSVITYDNVIEEIKLLSPDCQ